MEDGEIIREGYKISEIFNDHYVNIIENITGKKQEESQVTNIDDMKQHEKEATLDSILERYSSHPSIVSIKMHCPNDGPKFKFTKGNPDDICQLIKGQLHSKSKSSSNERAQKMQKNEPSLTSMRQMVLEISQPKVRNLSKMEVAILKVFSLIFT